MSSIGAAHAVKVKVVVTRHVQTDAAQFKSVVQNLTGKDAVVGPGPEVDRPASDGKPGTPGVAAGKGSRGPCEPAASAGPHGELERMFVELPTLDEIADLWRD